MKLLYEKAKEIESQIISVDYEGNPGRVGRLVEVTEKLAKAPDVRIVTLPACRMATSGVKQGDNHERFSKMWGRLDSQRKDRFFPRDFMFYDHEKGNTVWWYAVEDWVTEDDTEGFKIIDFDGGLYATAVGRDFLGDIAMNAYNGIKDWVAKHDNFELDERPGHYVMFHATGPDYALLGYTQVEYFFPIRIVKKIN